MHIRKLALLAFVLTLVHSVTAQDAVVDVDVYILSGQSNMQGVGQCEELPVSWREAPAQVEFWDGVHFAPLEPGVTKTAGKVSEFGPEVGFARTLSAASPSAPIRLIKVHRSGQPLHWGWDGGKWVGGAPAPGRRTFWPGEGPDDACAGTHYLALRDACRAALAALRARGENPTVRGMVWMQGEADAKHETSAKEYAESLALLDRRLTEDLGVARFPLVFGQVLPHEPALPRFTHRVELRSSQAAADRHSGDPRAIPDAWMVPTEAMPLRDDTVHYDTCGQMALGQVFGVTMLLALSSR